MDFTDFLLRLVIIAFPLALIVIPLISFVVVIHAHFIHHSPLAPHPELQKGAISPAELDHSSWQPKSHVAERATFMAPLPPILLIGGGFLGMSVGFSLSFTFLFLLFLLNKVNGRSPSLDLLFTIIIMPPQTFVPCLLGGILGSISGIMAAIRVGRRRQQPSQYKPNVWIGQGIQWLIGSIPIICITLQIVVVLSMSHFDDQYWKQKLYRRQMVSDLLNQNILIGKSKADIIDLLGKPDTFSECNSIYSMATDGPNPQTMGYILGGNWRYYGTDRDYLIIGFYKDQFSITFTCTEVFD
jgi:hypothetical protein